VIRENANSAYSKALGILERESIKSDVITNLKAAGEDNYYVARQENNFEIAGDDTAVYVAGWDEIYDYLKSHLRKISHTRNTNETKIKIEINIDGSGQYNISTGLGFFDHMLEQFSKHSGIDLTLHVQGDLHIDEHHTVEDTAIALGESVLKALGDKRGMERYGFLLPMDDCLAQAAIDFGGRNWLVWDADFKREHIGDVPTEMFYHFFKSFCDGAKCNLNIKAEGANEHHKIESIFKAFAKAVKMAVAVNYESTSLPTTKGIL
jgi:imidazoleglycerol-phosphate dehydratase/histidinol-phosphatase